MASFMSFQSALAVALWCHCPSSVFCLSVSRQHHATDVSADEQASSEVIPEVSDAYLKMHGMKNGASSASLARARRNDQRSSRAVAFCLGVMTSIVISIVLFVLFVAHGWMQEDTSAKGTACDREQPQATSDSSQVEVPASNMPDVSMSCTQEVESMHLFWPRVSFLVVLMLCQSISSMILDWSSNLFVEHTAIMAFLTMIVGLGGNVGGQSVVLSVRNFATGKKTEVCFQSWVTAGIVCFLLPVIFLRLLLDRVSFVSLVTICISCALIIVLASVLGFGIPFAMNKFRMDPAHATPVIQVVMDIIGVSVVCLVGKVICG